MKKLTSTQKSNYIIIYNATMIGRSLGKTFKSNATRLDNYKKDLFAEIEVLCKKMDRAELTNGVIRNSIKRLKERYEISYGQSQKAINVILKFHCLLYERDNMELVKKELDCPLDSIVLNKLVEMKLLDKVISLKDMDSIFYINTQERIQKEEEFKIDFDRFWDEQHQEGI